MLRIGEIYGELTLRAKQYQKELGNQERLTKKFAKGIRNVFLGVTAVFAGITYAVARITKSLITAYSQQEVAERKLEAALLATKGAAGLTLDEMKSMAMELRELTAIDDDVIMGAQGIMVTFTKISKEVFPTAIKAAMDMSVMFGQDLQQSVIQLGTALNDPIRGIGRLRRIGISFTEEQRKMIEGFVATNDVIGAQRVILDELEAEFGGVAESLSTTTEGAIKQFRNALEDIREELGERIAPVISTYAILMSKSFKIMKEHLDVLLPGFNELSESSEKATRLGLAFSVTTTRGIFKMRAGVLRLKIVFWSLVMVLSRVIQEMYGQLKWGTLIWRKYGEAVAWILDKLFKTKLREAIRGMGDFFADSGEQWKMYTDEAKEQMWILYEELVKVNDREKYSIDELIEAYDKLIAKKLAAVGVLPGAPPAGGEGAGKKAKSPLEDIREFQADKILDRIRQDMEKVTKETKDLSQAAAQFGATLTRALTSGKISTKELLDELIRLAVQMMIMNIFSPGSFLSGFAGAWFKKGGAAFPKNFGPPFMMQEGGATIVKDATAMTPMGNIAHKGEFVLTPDQMMQVLNRPVNFNVFNADPDLRIERIMESSMGAQQKFGRFLEEKVLRERDRLKGKE